MGCIRKTLAFIGIIKAIISRLLFAGHGFVCIWRVTVVKQNSIWWALTGTLPVLLLETIYTLKKKRGGEWKWICPSVSLYLATVIPAIWFLELDLLNQRIRLESGRHKIVRLNHKVNVWNGEINLPINLVPDDWCKILEQMLLLILIVGRWLLPKGEISREQLSQLLLVYIGMAADIIELFEAFKEREVKTNKILTIIIMSLWTASLLQFTFVLTATKSKRMRPVLFHEGSTSSTVSVSGKSCCPTEVISIMISVTLQDGPFLVLRMLLIFRYNVISYTNLFFTSKNSLVLILQFYRLFVLFCQKPESPTTLFITSDSFHECNLDVDEDSVDDSEAGDSKSVISMSHPPHVQDADIIVEASKIDKKQTMSETKYVSPTCRKNRITNTKKLIPTKDDSEAKKQNSESGIEDDVISSGSDVIYSTISTKERVKPDPKTKNNWNNVKTVSRAISFVNQAGNSQYKTVVLSSEDHSGSRRYVMRKPNQKILSKKRQIKTSR